MKRKQKVSPRQRLALLRRALTVARGCILPTPNHMDVITSIDAYVSSTRPAKGAKDIERHTQVLGTLLSLAVPQITRGMGHPAGRAARDVIPLILADDTITEEDERLSPLWQKNQTPANASDTVRAQINALIGNKGPK